VLLPGDLQTFAGTCWQVSAGMAQRPGNQIKPEGLGKQLHALVINSHQGFTHSRNALRCPLFPEAGCYRPLAAINAKNKKSNRG
jgi:hypothetical protein